MNYVISDVHGNYKKFDTMLCKVGFSKTDRLYIVGDVVDRGEAPLDVLSFIIQNANIEFLLGNHEDMFLDYLSSRNKETWKQEIIKRDYIRNGGEYTLKQFEKLNTLKQNKIVDYLSSRPLYKVVDHYLLVHSGVVIKDAENLSLDNVLTTQTREDFLWTRQDFFLNPAIPDMTVIFGHTPTYHLFRNSQQEIPSDYKIWHDPKYHDKIGIDCGAGFEGGRLGCLCLDNMQEFYV